MVGLANVADADQLVGGACTANGGRQSNHNAGVCMEPAGWVPVATVHQAGNPMTDAKVELGRYLFYDTDFGEWCTVV